MTAGLPPQLRNALLDSSAWGLWQRVLDYRELPSWQKAGKPVPPPHLIKQRIVSTYASIFGIDTLIETGTYLGAMVDAMRNRFQTILSVELSGDLAKRAAHRFRACLHTQILQGDSGEVLPQILDGISGRCLFWLDGHYSGGITAKGKTDTPVMKEVRIILEHGVEDHVILIDDARFFNGTQDYPTLDELRELFAQARPGHVFSVSNDVIRIHPEKAVFSEF